MKKSILCTLLSTTLLLSLFLLVSCNDRYDSYDKQYFSLATVVPTETGEGYILTLDDGTTIYPKITNGNYTPQKRYRAFVTYLLLTDKYQEYDYVAKVLELREVLTKDIAENLHGENDTTYGVDPITIRNMWIGDDYLNVEFVFYSGGSDKKHLINLVQTNDTDSLYLELRHNAYDHSAIIPSRVVVSFDLSSLNVKEESVTLTIKVNTFDGNKEYTKKFVPKKSGS